MNTKPLLSICDWYDNIILLDRRDIKKQMSSYEHSLTPEHRHYKTTATINSQPAPSGIYQTDEEKVENSDQRKKWPIGTHKVPRWLALHLLSI